MADKQFNLISNLIKGIVPAIIVLLVLIFIIASPLVIVPSGYVGVKLTLGKAEKDELSNFSRLASLQDTNVSQGQKPAFQVIEPRQCCCH